MLKKELKSLSWQNMLASVMFALLVLSLIGHCMPYHYGKAYYSYMSVITSAIAGIYFFKNGFSGTIEVKLILAYTVWLLVSRWLHKDVYLWADFDLVIEVLFSFLLFAVCSELDKLGRERFLNSLALFYSGFFVILSVLGLFVTLTDTYLYVLPEKSVKMFIQHVGGLNSLILISEHRLVCAVRSYIAWALLIYAFINSKTLIKRILIIAGLVILHLTIPLFHSRTIQIILSLSYGMLALLVFQKLLSRKAVSMRISLLVLITAAATVLCYLSFGLSNSFVSGMRSITVPSFASFYEQLEQKPDTRIFGIDNYEASADTDEEIADNAEYSDNMTDERDITANTTLSGRTGIWADGIEAIRRNPSILAIGSLDETLIDPVNEIRSEKGRNDQPHLHNMFIQVLLLTGLPGLIIIVGWSVLMMNKMIRMYFNNSDDHALADRFLVIPLTGMFIYHLVEVNIFTNYDIFGMVFIALSGLFLSACHDHLIQDNRDITE